MKIQPHLSFVMAGLVPAIHVLEVKSWMPAPSAGMTVGCAEFPP